METIKKRILCITFSSILFVGSIIGVIFPLKNNLKNTITASAQDYTYGTTFNIGLPTFNSLMFKGTDNTYYRPTPYVAVIGNRELTIAPSLDGFTPDSSVVKNWFVVPIDSLDYQFEFKVYGNNGFNLTDYDINVTAYANSFNTITDDYLPYRLMSHYIFIERNGVKYIYCDYYIDYVKSDNFSDVIRGAGFSIRIPVRDYNFNSSYKGYLGDGVPSAMYNVIDTTDVLGWSYSSISTLLNEYDIGYQFGYDDGERAGYNRGYTEGVANSNDYTFTSLISSVIDVPINAFRSLFNFDLLGFNMANFMMSLLTLGGVLAIIRLIL